MYSQSKRYAPIFLHIHEALCMDSPVFKRSIIIMKSYAPAQTWFPLPSLTINTGAALIIHLYNKCCLSQTTASGRKSRKGNEFCLVVVNLQRLRSFSFKTATALSPCSLQHQNLQYLALFKCCQNVLFALWFFLLIFFISRSKQFYKWSPHHEENKNCQPRNFRLNNHAEQKNK